MEALKGFMHNCSAAVMHLAGLATMNIVNLPPEKKQDGKGKGGERDGGSDRGEVHGRSRHELMMRLKTRVSIAALSTPQKQPRKKRRPDGVFTEVRLQALETLLMSNYRSVVRFGE